MIWIIGFAKSKKWRTLWIFILAFSCSDAFTTSTRKLLLRHRRRKQATTIHAPTSVIICWNSNSENPSSSLVAEDSSASTSRQSLHDVDGRIYLLSLKSPDDEHLSSFARTFVRGVWKWKDRVLGDGRDFFVPKPNILNELHGWIIQQTRTTTTTTIEECAILSNCARLEVLLVLSSSSSSAVTTTTTTTTTIDEVIPQVSACFQSQVESYQRRPMKTLLFDPLSSWDWPGMIDTTASIDLSNSSSFTDDNMIRSHWHAWNHLQGIAAVARHLSLVAAGMAVRPSRPNRPVPFRPFSARDAHVMLQLKRTQQIFATSDQPCLSLLLETALRAGKAARTTASVPELALLLQYGTGNSKYEMEPPHDVMVQVAEAARIKAVEPMVMECIAKFKAMQASRSISHLRQAAEALLENNHHQDQRRWMQQQLHLPTMQLRNGEHVDIHQLVLNLQEELRKRTIQMEKVQTTSTRL